MALMTVPGWAARYPITIGEKQSFCRTRGASVGPTNIRPTAAPAAAAPTAIRPCARALSASSPRGPLLTHCYCCCQITASPAAVPSHSRGPFDTLSSCSTVTSSRRRLTGKASSWGRCMRTASKSSISIGSTSNRMDREGSKAPLRLVELPGKGRGVVATRKLSPGELLLVCRPLALVQGPSHGSVLAQQQQQKEKQRRQQQPRSQSQMDAPNSFSRPASTAANGVSSVGARVSASQPELTGPTAIAIGHGPAAAAVGGTANHCSEAALVSELKRLEWGPHQARILAFLYRGVRQAPGPAAQPGSRSSLGAMEAAGGGVNSGCSGGMDLDLSDLTDPWAGNATAPDAAAAMPPPQVGPAAAAGAAATHGPGLSAEELAAVVRLNATGLPSDDVLLAQLYERPNMSFIGLWPAHAMFNHSCAPNAVAVISGSELHIHCCSPVSAGGEVCITYSGALGLGPLPLRRALLERNHRFRCTCPRCTAEERVPRELAQLWSDVVMLASQQLQPQLLAATSMLRGSGSANSSSSSTANGSGGSNGLCDGGGASGSAANASGSGAAASAAAAALPSLLNVRGQVAKCCALFEETLGQLAATAQEALWLQSSMYPLYETRTRCAQLIANAAAAAAAVAASTPAAPQAPPRRAAATSAQLPPRQEQPQLQETTTTTQQQGRQQHEDLLQLERRLSEEYLDALSACLRLQGVANAGSDMHVQLAARYDAACAAHLARHPGSRAQEMAAEARTRLERALGTRYSIPVDGVQEAATTAAVTMSAQEQEEPRPVSLKELLVALHKLQEQK